MGEYITYLDKLGFSTPNGLVHNLDEAQNNVERLYIEEVKKLNVPADAVFFRRFYHEDSDEWPYSSAPAVCIFKKNDSFFNTDQHKDLHAALWSAGKTEIYVIEGDSRIDIINARKPAKRISNNDVSLDYDELLLVQASLKEFDDSRFSAHLFGSGTFWEQTDFKEKIDGNSNPYTFLLDFLMEARSQLIGNSTLGLDAGIIDKLLITSILLKFLEEIRDDNGKHTLREIYRDFSIENFEEALLQEGTCIKVITSLAQEFNGKIFDTFSEDELNIISKTNLAPVAKFLSADIDIKTNQLFIWKQYSFQHLPAEVISAIYENFIQAEAERNGEKKKGVVYTPLHLVNLLIDEVMPLDKPELFHNNSFKVLDPACGSGVFLVSAYKRMLQWWTINHWKKTGQIIYPNKTIAKQILENNIFGVDIEKVAALVSVFGLTTAFLDKLTPKEIWNNLRFQNLEEKNIQGLNFTDWAKAAKKSGERFDLVIGNPPFNASSKGTITNKDLNDLFGKKVPGNKLALKFFEAALFFGKRVCMIIPSNVFLYNKSTPSHNYRKEIFTNYTVEKIYDFTHLRRDLFHKTADTPVIALVVEKVRSQNQRIEHIVVKRQLLSERKIRFEIDYYDNHQVRWDWAIDEDKQFVWKTNLLGGGRLFHLVYRLSLFETLSDLVKKQKGWKVSRGYEGGDKIKVEGQKEITEIEENGSPVILQDATIETNNLKTYFIYRPPFLIFEQRLGKNHLNFSLLKKNKDQKSDLYYSRNFIGISVPEAHEVALENLYKRMTLDTNHLNYQLFILAISSNCLILHETAIRQGDILSIPIPKYKHYLELSEAEKIIQDDVLNYYKHLGKAISQNSAGKILYDPITFQELKAFGQTYCNALNEIYAQGDKSWQPGQILQTPTFISYQFGFGKNRGLEHDISENTEQKFQDLLNDEQTNQGMIHKRIIRYYNHVDGYDCVYLIKPINRRYWLRSIALRDADDTFMDLKKAGF